MEKFLPRVICILILLAAQACADGSSDRSSELILQAVKPEIAKSSEKIELQFNRSCATCVVWVKASDSANWQHVEINAEAEKISIIAPSVASDTRFSLQAGDGEIRSNIVAFLVMANESAGSSSDNTPQTPPEDPRGPALQDETEAAVTTEDEEAPPPPAPAPAPAPAPEENTLELPINLHFTIPRYDFHFSQESDNRGNENGDESDDNLVSEQTTNHEITLKPKKIIMSIWGAPGLHFPQLEFNSNDNVYLTFCEEKAQLINDPSNKCKKIKTGISQFVRDDTNSVDLYISHLKYLVGSAEMDVSQLNLTQEHLENFKITVDDGVKEWLLYSLSLAVQWETNISELAYRQMPGLQIFRQAQIFYAAPVFNKLITPRHPAFGSKDDWGIIGNIESSQVVGRSETFQPMFLECAASLNSDRLANQIAERQNIAAPFLQKKNGLIALKLNYGGNGATGFLPQVYNRSANRNSNEKTGTVTYGTTWFGENPFAVQEQNITYPKEAWAFHRPQNIIGNAQFSSCRLRVEYQGGLDEEANEHKQVEVYSMGTVIYSPWRDPQPQHAREPKSCFAQQYRIFSALYDAACARMTDNNPTCAQYPNSRANENGNWLRIYQRSDESCQNLNNIYPADNATLESGRIYEPSFRGGSFPLEMNNLISFYHFTGAYTENREYLGYGVCAEASTYSRIVEERGINHEGVRSPRFCTIDETTIAPAHHRGTPSTR